MTPPANVRLAPVSSRVPNPERWLTPAIALFVPQDTPLATAPCKSKSTACYPFAKRYSNTQRDKHKLHFNSDAGSSPGAAVAAAAAASAAAAAVDVLEGVQLALEASGNDFLVRERQLFRRSGCGISPFRGGPPRARGVDERPSERLRGLRVRGEDLGYSRGLGRVSHVVEVVAHDEARVELPEEGVHDGGISKQHLARGKTRRKSAGVRKGEGGRNGSEVCRVLVLLQGGSLESCKHARIASNTHGLARRRIKRQSAKRRPDPYVPSCIPLLELYLARSLLGGLSGEGRGATFASKVRRHTQARYALVSNQGGKGCRVAVSETFDELAVAQSSPFRLCVWELAVLTNFMGPPKSMHAKRL